MNMLCFVNVFVRNYVFFTLVVDPINGNNS